MSNQKKVGKVIVFCLCLSALSGCNKLTNWASHNFKQAEQYAQEYAKPVKDYLRSSSTYNFLTPVGDFSALLLSETVRRSYVDYYSYRHSLDKDQKEFLLQRLLSENDNYISFYVAGNQPPVVYSSARAFFTGQYQKLNTMLGEKDSFWKAFLKVDGKEYPAYRVKLETLPAEYKYFFGDHFSQFKKTYMIIFDVQLDNAPHDLALVLRSTEHEVDMKWEQILYSSH